MRAALLVALLVPLVGCTSTVDDKLSTPVDSGVVTDAPQSTQEPQAPLPSVSIVEVFGSGVVDLLNAVDTGGPDEKHAVCQGVREAVAGLTRSQISDAKSAMTDYDQSVLQDLFAECEVL
ncbi:hypothetical protein [Sanguibacter sp. Leaf3]|uniref:hypothetical protein n=1 Tax=Sanguibacter sp. Leaf3 TaxID=1736209 RepID=UPI0006FFC79C|nr:hypothetical protein [Sanguibacter sp. Leaf3]KQT98397.1 hypothetical protein ASG53_12105 [Sanguibacter sp. Leaf3]